MGLSSNILWHQTKKDGFYEILKSKKLLYSYSLERIIPIFRLGPIAFPMISASNYPISEIGNNDWRYGNYCIGFRQDWGVNVVFSPVWYCSSGSHSLRLVNVLRDDAIKKETQSYFGVLMAIFANMKFDQAPLVTKNSQYGKYRFYDEREWRVVPYITGTDQASFMPFLTEDGYKEFKEKNNGMSLLDFGVDFQYDDIHYIIVESEADIKKTREIVGDGIHVFTKSEVIEDVIGTDHHEEIRPTPEQQDFEAAMRHIERLMKRAKEKWDERKMDSEKQRI